MIKFWTLKKKSTQPRSNDSTNKRLCCGHCIRMSRTLHFCGYVNFSCSYLSQMKLWNYDLLYNMFYYNIIYYSTKIFSQFWLVKSTRIIHHNQLLMTKFGRILCLTRKWRQKCSPLQVKAPLTEKTWGQDWVVLVVKKKNGEHFTRFKSKNYSWD